MTTRQIHGFLQLTMKLSGGSCLILQLSPNLVCDSVKQLYVYRNFWSLEK